MSIDLQSALCSNTDGYENVSFTFFYMEIRLFTPPRTGLVAFMSISLFYFLKQVWVFPSSKVPEKDIVCVSSF